MNRSSKFAARLDRSTTDNGAADIKIPAKFRRALAELEYDEAKLWLEIYVNLSTVIEGMQDPREREFLRWVEEHGPPELKAEVGEVVSRMAEDAAAIREITERYIQIPEEPDPVPAWVPQSRATKYGITVEQGLALLAEQEFRCAICRNEFVTPKDVRFDHNHATGAFRAFLCHGCNTGLGHLKDSRPIIAAALDYLRKHGCYGPEVLP